MQHSISSQISASLQREATVNHFSQFLYFISFLFTGFPTFFAPPLSSIIRSYNQTYPK